MVVIVSVLAVSCKLGAELFLEVLNRQSASLARTRPPGLAVEVMGAERFDRSVAYTLEKSRFGSVEMLWSSAFLITLLVTGWLGGLHDAISGTLGYGVWGQALTFLLVMGILSIPNLPLDWWETFRIETRHGFNKSTPRLWLADRVKMGIVGLLLGTPLLTLIFWIVTLFPETWWLVAWGVFFGFQLLMIVLFPMFIVPLFNKLEPLEEGPLKERLMALAERTGFRAATIQVIDGSKRSAHSNAYFTGFGRFRRIVLYDTLIEQLGPEEIEAVLAHEIGHYRKGHIPKTLAVFAVVSLGVFWGLAALAGFDGLVEEFGFAGIGTEGEPLARVAPLFLLASLLLGAVTFWVSPLMNALSRKNEYEADAFARDAVGSGAPLKEALRKIYRENLGNLVPHRLYSGFHYSHPTLLERERALEETAGRV